jgi:hypothetical protein
MLRALQKNSVFCANFCQALTNPADQLPLPFGKILSDLADLFRRILLIIQLSWALWIKA